MTDSSNALDELDLPKAWRQACERPDAIRVGGREYVWAEVASKRLYLSASALHRACREGHIPSVYVGRRRYIQWSAAKAWVDRLDAVRTQRDQVRDWLNSHPQAEWDYLPVREIQAHMARDGQKVSRGTIKTVLRERGTDSKKRILKYRVAAWLDEDPERRWLPRREMRLQAERALKRRLHQNMMTYACRVFDARHGTPYPQGEDWMTIPEAAEYAGLNRDTLRRWRVEGRLTVWRGPGGNRARGRVRKADLDQALAEFRARQSMTSRAAAWIAAHPESADMSARQIGDLLGVSPHIIPLARARVRGAAHGTA